MTAGYSVATALSPAQVGGRTLAPDRALIGRFLLFCLLFVALPLLAVWPLSPSPSFSTACCLTAILLCAVRLSGSIASNELNPAAFSAYMFFYIWYGLAQLAQLAADSVLLVTPFLGSRPSSSTYDDRASLLALVALVVFDLAYRFGASRQILVMRHQVDRKRLSLLVLATVPAMVIGLQVLGGPALLVSPRAAALELVGAEPGGSLALVGIGRALLRGPVLVAVVVWLSLRSAKVDTRFLGRLTPWLLIGLLLLIANPIVFPRFWSGTAITAIVYSRIRYSSARTRQWALVIVILIAVVVFPYADVFRRSFAGDIAFEPVVVQLTSDGTFSMYGQTILGLRYVDSEGHTFGRQALTASLFFVPRSVWPGKSSDTGDLVAAGAGLPSRLNPSAPLPVEAYVDGGYVAMILVMASVGYALARLDLRGWSEHRAGLVGRGTILTAVVPAYLPYLLRGSLLPSVPLFAVLLALVVWLTPKRRWGAAL